MFRLFKIERDHGMVYNHKGSASNLHCNVLSLFELIVIALYYITTATPCIICYWTMQRGVQYHAIYAVMNQVVGPVSTDIGTPYIFIIHRQVGCFPQSDKVERELKLITRELQITACVSFVALSHSAGHAIQPSNLCSLDLVNNCTNCWVAENSSVHVTRVTKVHNATWDPVWVIKACIDLINSSENEIKREILFKPALFTSKNFLTAFG